MAITGRSFPSHSVSARNTAGTIVGAARGSHTSTGLVFRPRTNSVLRNTVVRNAPAQVIVFSPTISNIHVFSIAPDRRQPPRTSVLDFRTPLAEITRAKASGINVFSVAADRRQPPRTQVIRIRTPLEPPPPPPPSNLALQFTYYP